MSTLDAVLNFVHNLGDFILLILSLPFSAVISWWYGSSTDEDQAGLTEVDSESVRSYGDDQPAPSKNRSEYPNPRSPMSREESQSGGAISGGSRIPYPRGVSRDTRNSSDTLRSRFYARPDASSQIHEIWNPPPSSHEVIDEDHADYPTNVPSVVMPEPRVPTIAVDDWPTYPPFPSAYPPTPVHSSQVNMPEPVHPSQFGIVMHEQGTGGAVANNDQTDGVRQGFGRSLLPLREPLNPGSDGDLSDEMKNPGVQIYETRYVTSSDSEGEMEDYETEDSFDVTFQTPKHRRILWAVPMGREVSNVSIVTEATVASSAPSEMTGLTTDHHASSLRTTTVTISRSTSLGSSSAAGVKRPLPNHKIGVHPRKRAADHRSPRKAGPARGTGRFSALPRPVSLRTQREGTVSEDTLDDEDLKDPDASHEDDALLTRKRRRVSATSGARRTAASRPTVRGPRNVSQSSVSASRPAQVAGKYRIARPPVATKTSLRNVNPRVARGAAALSGSTTSPHKARQPLKRATSAFRP